MFLFDTSFRLDPPLDKVWLTCRALAALSLISIDFSEVRLCLLSSKSHAPAWALSSPASLATYIKMQSKRKKPVVKCRKTEGKTLKGSVETSGDPWTIFFFSKLLFCKTSKENCHGWTGWNKSSHLPSQWAIAKQSSESAKRNQRGWNVQMSKID